MTWKEYEEIKTINKLPDGATYYLTQEEKRGINYYHWYEFYDKDFILLDCAHVKYTSILDSVKRICKEKDIENIIYVPYRLTDLNNGFFLVEEKDSTKEGLIQIATEGLDLD